MRPGMQKLKLYQIDLKYLVETVDRNLIYAISSEVDLIRNYDLFTFKSIANRLNYLMNHDVIEGWSPAERVREAQAEGVQNIDPNSVEIYGVHPFRNKEHIFHISNEEVFIMIHRSDFIRSCV